ncbi:MAG: hypothetical protein JSS62_02600 [Verrucomicrobia bacterium]|nr:hypothetical protein [Verrucomicrobiota bacterium]MBS0645374.1 hypothetical protein [Verrucomicrobiota bacterium]
MFCSSRWEGEGNITLSVSDQVISYKVVWIVSPPKEDRIFLHQIVTIQDFDQMMTNQFCISQASKTNFDIELSNQLVCGIKGKGVIDPQVVAWEFRETGQEFEGFEVYRLQPDESYEMHAEYSASEGMRTLIQGYIRLSEFE